MDTSWIASLVFVALTAIFTLLLNFNRLWYEPRLKPGQSSLPPGSLGWPIFGNMGAFLHAFKSGKPDSFIARYVQKYNRAGVYKAFMFWQPTVLATTPETCKVVLTKSLEFETGWPSSTRALIGNKSLAGVTGAEHLKLRKLTEPTVRSPKALEQCVPQMVNNIKRCLEDWSRREQVYLLTEIRKYAFLTIHGILFGDESTLDADEVASLYHQVNHGVRALPINLPGTSYNKALKARKRLAKILQKAIDERRTDKDVQRKDTLSLMMEATDDNGERLSDEQIVDMLVMFLNAGHDSSAHLILWLVIFLHRHKDVYSKVKAEQDLIQAEKSVGEMLTLSDIKKMSYLSNVIDETLRLANISPMVFRRALSDVEVNGFTIPKGWTVEAWLRQVHMDDHVHENPWKFDPERWTRDEIRPFTHIPFGLGNRTCPGNELAKLEAHIVVHHLVTGYELKALNPECSITYLPHPRPKDLFPVQLKRLSSL